MRKFFTLSALLALFTCGASYAQLTSYNNEGTYLHAEVFYVEQTPRNTPRYDAMADLLGAPDGTHAVSLESWVDINDDQGNGWTFYNGNGGNDVLDNYFDYDDPYGNFTENYISFYWVVYFSDGSYEDMSEVFD